MDDRPKRILMLIDQFHPIVGGAEQQALRISLRLIEKGHTVLVLTRQSNPDLPRHEIYQGIDIYRLPVIGVSGKSKLKSTYPAVKWLIDNKDKYDIIHCHGVNPLEWGALFASFKTKKPYVLKIPLSNYLNYAGAKEGFKMNDRTKSGVTDRVLKPMMLPALKIVRKRLIKKADRVFAISPEISRTLEEGGLRNVANIPNGIDTEFFHPATPTEKIALRRQLNLNTDQILFVYSGRLAVEKNLETLLSAWDDFKRTFLATNARLIFLGSGKGQTYSTEDDLKQMVFERDIDNVVFMGTVDNVVDYLRAADCFILPSLWEGMSNSLLEAMACGLPSIVSDIPGNRALIDHDKSGLLFKPNDIVKLSEYIHAVTRDELLRKMMGQNARQIAVEFYSINKITEDILGEYQNILA